MPSQWTRQFITMLSFLNVLSVRWPYSTQRHSSVFFGCAAWVPHDPPLPTTAMTPSQWFHASSTHTYIRTCSGRFRTCSCYGYLSNVHPSIYFANGIFLIQRFTGRLDHISSHISSASWLGKNGRKRSCTVDWLAQSCAAVKHSQLCIGVAGFRWLY